MPERAIFALMPAVAGGFICGVIAASLVLQDTATLWLGVAGGALVLVSSASSVAGSRADPSEKVIVAVLRAAGGVVLFVCVYLFMLALFRRGDVWWALVWAVLALLVGLTLSQVRARRTRRPEEEEGEESAEPETG